MLHTAASIAVPKLVVHIHTKRDKEISTAENRQCSHTNLTYHILQDIGLSRYTLPVSGLQQTLPTLLIPLVFYYKFFVSPTSCF